MGHRFLGLFIWALVSLSDLGVSASRATERRVLSTPEVFQDSCARLLDAAAMLSGCAKVDLTSSGLTGRLHHSHTGCFLEMPSEQAVIAATYEWEPADDLESLIPVTIPYPPQTLANLGKYDLLVQKLVESDLRIQKNGRHGSDSGGDIFRRKIAWRSAIDFATTAFFSPPTALGKPVAILQSIEKNLRDKKIVVNVKFKPNIFRRVYGDAVQPNVAQLLHAIEFSDGIDLSYGFDVATGEQTLPLPAAVGTIYEFSNLLNVSGRPKNEVGRFYGVAGDTFVVAFSQFRHPEIYGGLRTALPAVQLAWQSKKFKKILGVAQREKNGKGILLIRLEGNQRIFLDPLSGNVIKE